MTPPDATLSALPPLTWEELPGLFPAFAGLGRWLPLLQGHARLLEAAAPAVRVTSVSPEDAVRRHYAESLEILRLIRDHSAGDTLVDVGSGGGFPGLIVAAVEPGTTVHLVEPLQKRARLLVEIAAELGLANVHVYAQRAEEAGRGPLRESNAIGTARAVAALPELLEYVAPLVEPGGLVALPKGSALAHELPAATAAMAALACGSPERVEARHSVSTQLALLLLERTGPVPAAYPRRPGTPAKKPLGQ